MNAEPKPLLDFVHEALMGLYPDYCPSPLPWTEEDFRWGHYGWVDTTVLEQALMDPTDANLEKARLQILKRKAQEIFREEKSARERVVYEARERERREREEARKYSKIERNTEHQWAGPRTQCFVRKSTDQSYFGSNCSKSAQFVVPLGNKDLLIGDIAIQDFALACTKHATTEAKYGGLDTFWPLHRGFDAAFRAAFYLEHQRVLVHLKKGDA